MYPDQIDIFKAEITRSDSHILLYKILRKEKLIRPLWAGVLSYISLSLFKNMEKYCIFFQAFFKNRNE